MICEILLRCVLTGDASLSEVGVGLELSQVRDHHLEAKLVLRL